MTDIRERGPAGVSTPHRGPLTVLAWTWVLVPFGYGVYELLLKIPALFSG